MLFLLTVEKRFLTRGIIETLDFANLCSKYLVKNNLYVVLISRAELPWFETELKNNSGEHRKALSISMNEIYNLVNDGMYEHWLEHDTINSNIEFADVDLIDRATYKLLHRCTHTRHSILADCYLISCYNEKVLISPI